MRNVTGSGPSANVYTDAIPDPDLGTGNRLVITGSPNAFSRTNQDILPMPGEQFFTGGQKQKRPAALTPRSSIR